MADVMKAYSVKKLVKVATNMVISRIIAIQILNNIPVPVIMAQYGLVDVAVFPAVQYFTNSWFNDTIDD